MAADARRGYRGRVRHPHLTLVLLAASCATQVEHEPIVAYHEQPPPPQLVEAPDALEPAQPRAEMLLECAEKSVEEFNDAETPTAAPLRKAASCYDAIGFWVNATKIQKVINQQFADQGDPDREAHFKGKAFEVMEQPAAARQTVWGQHCVQQRGPSPQATTALQVECAKKASFTAWVVELCGPAEARRQLDSNTQGTCSDFDGFLQRLKETIATKGR